MLSVEELVDRLIDLSFAEDIGDGDHTTLCCIPEDAMGKSHLLMEYWLVWRLPKKCSAVSTLR